MPASLMQTTQGFTSSFLSITSNATVMNAMSAPKKEIKSCVTKSMLHTPHNLFDFHDLASFRRGIFCAREKGLRMIQPLCRQSWCGAGAPCAPCHKGREDVLLYSDSSAIHFSSKDHFHQWNLLHLHCIIYPQ